MTNFEKSVAIIIDLEGGDALTNDPKDPGGLTKYGISKKAFPDIDIANLSYTNALDIYKKHYWEKLSLDLFNPDISLIIFDSAVNQGPRMATKLVQLSLGLKVDGIFGNNTAKAIIALSEFQADRFVRDFMARRMMHYSGLSTFNHYGRGWTNRVLIVFEHAVTEFRPQFSLLAKT